MSSQLKSETARTNGAQSNGPVTPQGRATSSRNSLRHDLETVRTMSHLAGPATPWPTSAAPSISPYGDMTVPGQPTPTPARHRASA